jgi:hypothetical protein
MGNARMHTKLYLQLLNEGDRLAELGLIEEKYYNEAK